MEKLTDQAIIQHYQQKKQTLTKELQKVEGILSVLGDNGSSAEAPKKRKYTRRASISEPTRAPKAKKAPTPTITTKETTTPKNTAKKVTPKPSSATSTGSNPKDSWDSKIQQALGQMGSATKENITQFIVEKDPTTSVEKVRKALTLRLAILEKKGTLKKEAPGKEYRIV